MKCPYCASSETRVINSRPSEEGTSIRRRRDCENCHRRFTTYERAQFEALMVNKRSGRREAFNPDKLLDKLRIACNKRPATEKQLREFAYGFEDEVQVPEISSEEIGLRTLKFLKALDDVAYIRFLSVYRDFDSVDRFIEEIKELSALERGEQPKPEVRDAGEARVEGEAQDEGAEQAEGTGASRSGKGRESPDEGAADADDTNRRSRTRSKPVAEQAPLIPPEALDPGDGSKN